ncbi:hypothetical protein C8C94_3558 [Acidovorax sp. 94]|uniref:hypothetical protein n=1 Tax=Acidovorax sp. 94 TaxID=2135633 RepID=UPI000EADC3D8|nr:hypothetical protein [Acidovorax sp. 94]RKR69036.1 hypothetical protein C8C94_3558 [Acidovorax sp. 94]
MTPLNRPTVHDLLQRPAMAAGVLMFSASMAVLLAALLALAAPADANARTRRSVEHNADGSTTTHTGVARSGPNGAMLRGRTATTDGQGNGSVTRRGAAVGVQGGVAARQGSTTRSVDGSASHSGTVSAQNAQGSLHSSGGASRNADGSVEQARSTTATSAATGNSVQTQSSYSKDSGLSRSATCYDASGTAMACPTRP